MKIITVNHYEDFSSDFPVSQDILPPLTEKDFNLSGLDSKIKNRLFQLLISHKSAFACSTVELSAAATEHHRISLQHDYPIKCPIYKIPFNLRNEFRRQIADLEKAGIISKSNSQYNTPALFVKQKEKWRLVLDFRKLNEITLTQDFVIPTLDDILHEISGSNYFSALDMKRYIKNFAKRALPLTNLLRKDTPFEWTSETQEAFDDIKKAILNPPVLALPDPDAELQITTDASSRGIGAVLEQKYPNSESYGHSEKTHIKLFRSRQREDRETQSKSLANILASISQNTNDCDEQLPHTMLALNSAIHEATYTSPFFLEHGRDIRLSYTFEKNSDTPQNKYEYVEKLLPSLEQIFNKVLNNLKEQEASHVDLSTRATKQHHYDYKIGSLCFIKTPNIKSNLFPKLRPKFECPYRVIERFSNVNYRVQHVEQLRKRFNTHVNRMIPFIKRFSYLHLNNLDDLQNQTRRRLRVLFQVHGII
ncbi:integrase catalytic domain-containing protein [Trichonephila clavipes]|nr:integrase catalytic domain-containing protein [Trichonephila clavipes]